MTLTGVVHVLIAVLAFGAGGAPTRVAAAAGNGSWVVLCQARADTNHDGKLTTTFDSWGVHGDVQRPYLVIAGGEGVELENFLAIDPTRRRAVVRRDQRVLVTQPGLGRDVDLTSLGFAGGLAFDPTGDAIVYSKRSGAIVVREFASGKERTLSAGAGVVDRIELDPSGAWIVYWIAHGKFHSDEHSACGSDLVFAYGSDPGLSAHARRLDGGPSTDSDESAAIARTKAVLNHDDGELLARYGDWSVVDRSATLFSIGPNRTSEIGETFNTRSAASGGRYLYVDPWLIDVETGAIIATAPTGAKVLAVADDGRLLVGHDGALGIPNGPLEWVAPVFGPPRKP